MPSHSRRSALHHLAVVLAVATGVGRSGAAVGASEAGWIVDAVQARTMIEQGALVLDARGPQLKEASPVPGAVPVVWQRFAEPDLPTKGRLLADDALLNGLLQEVGVRADTPVVVLGDPLHGWGEDGRIVWMLRSLGHRDAVLVDGGLPALRAAGLPQIGSPPLPGDFVVARRGDLEVSKQELKGLLGREDLVVVDTRDPLEYAGATPYGETRGGHLPGARTLPFKDLLAADGTLLPPEQLQAKLAALGIGPGTKVVSYCTGGVRSGWMTSVLNHLGLDARNFAGSIWEWSADDPEQYPLVVAN